MISNFILLPFLLFWLNEEAYGLWCVFLSLGGITTLFDFGFNVTFARNITYCWSGVKSLKKSSVEVISGRSVDYTLLKRLLNTCRRVYLIISIITLLVLGVLGSVYILYVSKNMQPKEVLFAWMIYSGAVFVNILFGYYNSFLRGIGDIEGVNKSIVISKFIHILLVIILLSLGCGLLGASIGYFVYGVSFAILAKRSFLNHEGIRENLSNYDNKPDNGLFKIIWHNSWREGMVQSADYLCNQLTVVMVSFYCSLTETGAYSLSLQLSQAIVMVATVIYSAYQPELQSSYANKDNDNVKNILSLVLTSCTTISLAGGVILITVGEKILQLVKPTIVLDSFLLCGVLIYQYLIRIRNCYTTYLSSTNRVIYAKSFLIAGLLTVFLIFIFLEFGRMGIWGVILGQVLAQLVFNFWYWPIMVHKELKLRITEVPKRSFILLKR